MDKIVDQDLLSSIRNIVKEELSLISTSISTSISSLSSDIQSALTTAKEAKSIAEDASKLANDLRSKITIAESAANEALNMAREASSLASEAKSVVGCTCKQELEALNEKTLRIESYSRRNNLKFEGLPENPKEIISQVMRQLLFSMGVDVSLQIVGCHRFGPRSTKPNEPRPVVVKFLRYEDRVQVWDSRRKLKGTSVRVFEDFPGEIDKRRKILWPYLTAAYEGDPKNPKGKISAYLMVDKLIINNQTYTSNMVESIPEYIKHRVENPTNMKQTDDVTVFFGYGSPLSNFHSAKFTIDDITFCNAEQYISYQKALLFEEPGIADEILSMKDPKLMKQKVKRLKKFDQTNWSTEAWSILKTALLAKFDQNDPLKQELLSTGTTNIGEASPTDSLFGIGLSLKSSHVTNSDKWTGKNITGVVLMEVRDSLNLAT